MNEMGRRRFIRYGVLSAILAGLGGVSAYFLIRRPVQVSGAVTLPPGQSEVQSLEVLQVAGVPKLSLDTWAFEVNGEVENPFKLNWNQFMQLPKTVSVSEFDCVTGWTTLDNRWEGVRFGDIARLARPTAKAKYATITCYGVPLYTTSLPLDYLMRDDVLFAYGLNGKPLEPEYGGPLRLVVPGKYGYKSAKWVNQVRFTETQEIGFWESRGYSNTADVSTNDRYG
jgi:DMSO/TMAO reductase YedYZ molybdopterin-dependent catalytic subunit